MIPRGQGPPLFSMRELSSFLLVRMEDMVFRLSQYLTSNMHPSKCLEKGSTSYYESYGVGTVIQSGSRERGQGRISRAYGLMGLSVSLLVWLI